MVTMKIIVSKYWNNWETSFLNSNLGMSISTGNSTGSSNKKRMLKIIIEIKFERMSYSNNIIAT